jgi:hypothetical protein
MHAMTVSSLSGKMLRIALLLTLGFLPTVFLEAKTPLRIACTAQVVESFKKWTAETPWEKIDDYANPNANRPTLDLILQLQALKAGGLDFDIVIVETPNNERSRLELCQGNADLVAETVWAKDVLKHGDLVIQTSTPLIRIGEFEKGIYVLPSNEKALSVHTLEDLQQLIGAVVSTWDLDIKTLTAIKPKGLEKPSRLESVYLMLQKNRADFTLLEFSSRPDMSNELGGVKLVPVPGVKIALADDRYYIISAKTPNAQAIKEAIDKGLAQFRADGRIERAFKQSGFFHPKVGAWKRLF